MLPRIFRSIAVVAAVTGLALSATPLSACPFCSAVQLTFSEEIAANDIAVIATLVERPEEPAGSDSDAPFAAPAGAEVAKCKFSIAHILKGEDKLGAEENFEALYFGQEPVGGQFLVFAVIIEDKPPAWKTPIALSERGVKYIQEMMALPESGADRLAFFQHYLEDADPLLAVNSYDEFARAPYADVIGLAPRMNHDKLVGWVKNTEISSSRRRLYLTMLGVCGQPEDAAMLEEMIRSPLREHKIALDAMIAAYLNLRGPDGLPLIVDLFIKDMDAEYTDTYSAVMALRFHGQERDVIPKEDLKAAMRQMLDRPQLADLVIPDLARWEDWTVVDRLVELFKNADETSAWVRVPVINYLRVCPLPEAKDKIEELRQIDPDAVKRASSSLLLLGGGKGNTGGTVKRPEGAAPEKAAEPK
jgi:hypothetical protein